MREKVTPEAIWANGLWNHFTGKKKWRITCGTCTHTWHEKVPIHEPSSAICPCCGSQNVWSAEAFEREYNAQQEIDE